MNEQEIAESAGTWRTDQMIDQIIARNRSAPPAGGDEALATELSGLGPIEWPADESGDRIARMVANRAGQRQHSQRREHGMQAAWTPRSRWAAAAAAVVLAVVAVQAGPWHRQPSGGNPPAASQGSASASPGHSESPSPGPSGGASGITGPASVTAMRIVASTGLFEPVAAATNNASFLICVTSSVCYSEIYVGNFPSFERTADGGVTWHRGAAWPRGGAFVEPNTPSCPAARTCAVVVGAGIAMTTDGFDHLRVRRLTVPGVTLDGGPMVSCAAADRCVVSAFSAGGGPSLAYTADGGATWTSASVPALGAGTQIWQLRCDRKGYCIAMGIGGTSTAGTLTVLLSADYGQTWTASRAYSEPDAQTLRLSCGDGRQCMLISDTGYLVQVTATLGGSVTVRRQPLPGVGSRGTGTAVSCVTARACFVAASAGGTGVAVIDATRNGGRTWTSLTLPKVNGQALGTVALLGCPSRAGCLGLAATLSQEASSQDRVLISDLP